MSGTLVLLHGAASNATRWAEFVEHARLERWKILRPDLRGNGTAALPRTRLGMDLWCDDLVAMLDRERCERAVIGGHCLGANIALQFAARHASRVRALVLIEPMPPQALAGSAAWLPYLRPVLLALYGASRALNACGIYRRRLAPLDLREWDRATRRGERQLTMLASLGVDLAATPLAAYTRMLAATAEPWPDARALAALPHCEVVELDAVHWIPTEQPEAMRRAIEDWLRRRVPETAPSDPRPSSGWQWPQGAGREGGSRY